MDVLLRCFDETGAMTANAGEIASPFEKLDILISEEVRHNPRQIVNNALVYAAGWGKQDAMQAIGKPGCGRERHSGRIRFRGHAAALCRVAWSPRYSGLAISARGRPKYPRCENWQSARRLGRSQRTCRLVRLFEGKSSASLTSRLGYDFRTLLHTGDGS